MQHWITCFNILFGQDKYFENKTEKCFKLLKVAIIMEVAKGSLSYLHAIINKVSVFVSSRKRQVLRAEYCRILRRKSSSNKTSSVKKQKLVNPFQIIYILCRVKYCWAWWKILGLVNSVCDLRIDVTSFKLILEPMIQYYVTTRN